ncbi:hypothetical protein [Bacterioplanoides sp. SCSIO 12839]|uniref:hypothetical protein n=1 Tax=Bacterioplanoides sp. SCSIO 12839 TaxID=2829569 RepID=UPI0021034DE3|nr:hypothetical protein [Bacterioplanoides sp. SCSIO 12839]UTW48090.1 hypothetical protein KFF03_16280 [Bacterioplanoides sp. SCSIO 12839]
MKQFLKAYFFVILLGFTVRVIAADNILLYLPISFVILTMAYCWVDFESSLKLFLLSLAPLMSSLLTWSFLPLEAFQALILVSAFESFFLGMIWLQLLDVLGLVRCKSD